MTSVNIRARTGRSPRRWWGLRGRTILAGVLTTALLPAVVAALLVMTAPISIAGNVAAAGRFILVAVPLMLALTGTIMWLVVGRALEPVERISAQAGRINRRHLDERMDVPQGPDVIATLATALNQMLDRLQTADRAQRRFVSNASHELRSPLATLTTVLEVAVRDPTGTTWRESTEILQTQVRRMSYLVADLLTLSRIDDAGPAIAVTDVDLDVVIHDEIRRLQAVSRHRISAALFPARIRGDPDRLSQVFRNILNNADRHAADAIAVTMHAAAGSATVDIDNDGDLIPPGERERIFDRFVRLEQSRSRESGGSGLGLSIAHEILQAHHGSIRATESPAGQCRFEVMLPLQEPPAIEPAPDMPSPDRVP